MNKGGDMERLLTKVEIAGVCGRFARPENKKQGLHLLAEMAADESQKATLKAVGEWLENIGSIRLNQGLSAYIQTFVRGEMPEERQDDSNR